MARESFIFYTSFYDALKELPNELRLKMYDTICVFAITGQEPELAGVEKALFELIKPPMLANFAKYENGCKGAEYGVLGGRPKKPQPTPQENPKKTPKKPQENPKKTPYEDVDVYVDVDITPPLSPPICGGREEKTAKTVFFETYPALSTKKAKDEGIDYNVLLEEFAKSTTLRGMYSFAKVAGLYESIKAGCFRDKVDAGVAAANARSAREKWYADKRARAEAAADKFRAIANGSERFKQIESRLAKLNIEMAKAEVYNPKLLKRLKADQKSYQEERLELLEHLGLEEWQLEAQYECDKCKDTGFKEDGHMCDCYKGA